MLAAGMDRWNADALRRSGSRQLLADEHPRYRALSGLDHRPRSLPIHSRRLELWNDTDLVAWSRYRSDHLCANTIRRRGVTAVSELGFSSRSGRSEGGA